MNILSSNLANIPRVIIENILVRLPVKSVIRFQCIRKDCKNIIKELAFIADYLQHSSRQNPSLLVECDGIEELRDRFCFLDSRFGVNDVQNAPLNDSSENASIVGSCNGLICLEFNDGNESPLPTPLLLWNPATSAVRDVPLITPVHLLSKYNYSVPGFGYSEDDDGGDFKIVRPYAVPGETITRVELFSLKSGTWKEIDLGILRHVRIDIETTGTVNGAIFWSGTKEGSEEEGETDVVQVIVSFDIANEVFTVIRKPHGDDLAAEKLTAYDNKLAILRHTSGDDNLTELWVFDEGTDGSWTKRYSGRGFSRTSDSMAIWGNEIVYIPDSREDNETGSNVNVCEPDSEEDDKTRSNVLCLLNLATGAVQRFPIRHRGNFYSIYNYVESPVSVDNN